MRWASRFRRRFQYRLALSPKPVGQRFEEPPRSTGGEIRLFLVLPPRFVHSELGSLLESYRDAGVDRVFLLDCAGRETVPERGGANLPIHFFRSHPHGADHALRRLLDRYGVGRWCVLGKSSGVMTGEDGCPVSLRTWCDRLEREGIDVIEARTGAVATSRVEQIGRDLRTGRLFRGTALVECPERAWDPPGFDSRVALLKYRKTMLLDQAMVLVGNARLGDQSLRFTVPAFPDMLSSDPRAVSRERRS
jgi:hypothetical protein